MNPSCRSWHALHTEVRRVSKNKKTTDAKKVAKEIKIVGFDVGNKEEAVGDALTLPLAAFLAKYDPTSAKPPDEGTTDVPSSAAEAPSAAVQPTDGSFHEPPPSSHTILVCSTTISASGSVVSSTPVVASPATSSTIETQEKPTHTAAVHRDCVVEMELLAVPPQKDTAEALPVPATEETGTVEQLAESIVAPSDSAAFADPSTSPRPQPGAPPTPPAAAPPPPQQPDPADLPLPHVAQVDQALGGNGATAAAVSQQQLPATVPVGVEAETPAAFFPVATCPQWRQAAWATLKAAAKAGVCSTPALDAPLVAALLAEDDNFADVLSGYWPRKHLREETKELLLSLLTQTTQSPLLSPVARHIVQQYGIFQQVFESWSQRWDLDLWTAALQVAVAVKPLLDQGGPQKVGQMWVDKSVAWARIGSVTLQHIGGALRSLDDEPRLVVLKLFFEKMKGQGVGSLLEWLRLRSLASPPAALVLPPHVQVAKNEATALEKRWSGQTVGEARRATADHECMEVLRLLFPGSTFPCASPEAEADVRTWSAAAVRVADFFDAIGLPGVVPHAERTAVAFEARIVGKLQLADLFPATAGIIASVLGDGAWWQRFSTPVATTVLRGAGLYLSSGCGASRVDFARFQDAVREAFNAAFADSQTLEAAQLRLPLATRHAATGGDAADFVPVVTAALTAFECSADLLRNLPTDERLCIFRERIGSINLQTSVRDARRALSDSAIAGPNGQPLPLGADRIRALTVASFWMLPDFAEFFARAVEKQGMHAFMTECRFSTELAQVASRDVTRLYFDFAQKAFKPERVAEWFKTRAGSQMHVLTAVQASAEAVGTRPSWAEDIAACRSVGAHLQQLLAVQRRLFAPTSQPGAASHRGDQDQINALLSSGKLVAVFSPREASTLARQIHDCVLFEFMETGSATTVRVNTAKVRELLTFQRLADATDLSQALNAALHLLEVAAGCMVSRVPLVSDAAKRLGIRVASDTHGRFVLNWTIPVSGTNSLRTSSADLEAALREVTALQLRTAAEHRAALREMPWLTAFSEMTLNLMTATMAIREETEMDGHRVIAALLGTTPRVARAAIKEYIGSMMEARNFSILDAGKFLNHTACGALWSRGTTPSPDDASSSVIEVAVVDGDVGGGHWCSILRTIFPEGPPGKYQVALPTAEDFFAEEVAAVFRRAAVASAPTCVPRAADGRATFAIVFPHALTAHAEHAARQALSNTAIRWHATKLVHRLVVVIATGHALMRDVEAFPHAPLLLAPNAAPLVPAWIRSCRAAVGPAQCGKSFAIEPKTRGTDTLVLNLSAQTTASAIVDHLQQGWPHASSRRSLLIVLSANSDARTDALLFSLLAFRSMEDDSGRCSCLLSDTSVFLEAVSPSVAPRLVIPLLCESIPVARRSFAASPPDARPTWGDCNHGTYAAVFLHLTRPNASRGSFTASEYLQLAQKTAEWVASPSDDAVLSKQKQQQQPATRFDSAISAPYLLAESHDGTPVVIVSAKPSGAPAVVTECAAVAEKRGRIVYLRDDNGVALGDAALRGVLDRVFGPAPPAVAPMLLRPALVVAMLRVYLYIASRACPSVLVGETGAGKTLLMRTLASRLAYRILVLDVSTGTTRADILAFLEKCVAERRLHPELPLLAFIDEFNATPEQDVLKMIFIDRKWPAAAADEISAATLKAVNDLLLDRDHVHFIAAANPYQCLRVGSEERLVYAVQPFVHPAVENCAWTLDAAKTSDTKAVVECMSQTEGLSAAGCALTTSVVTAWHEYYLCIPHIPVSLRTVHSMLIARRGVEAFLQHFDCTASGIPAALHEPEAASAIALHIFYALALTPKERADAHGRFPVLASTPAWNMLEDFIVTRLVKPFLPATPAVIMHDSLKEMLAALFVAYNARIHLLIVGPPGTSKSLAVSLLAAITDQEAFREQFHLPAMFPHYFQCSSQTTQANIRSTHKLAMVASAGGDGFRPVLCFDELAACENAPGNPLRVFNSLLDAPGTPAVFCTSNFHVDRAVLNRFVVVTRCFLSQEYLENLLRERGLSSARAHRLSDAFLTETAQLLDHRILSATTHVSEWLRRVGNRDMHAYLGDDAVHHFEDYQVKSFDEGVVAHFGFGVRAVRQPGTTDGRLWFIESPRLAFDATEDARIALRLQCAPSATGKRLRPLHFSVSHFADALHLINSLAAQGRAVEFICGGVLKSSAGMFNQQMQQLRRAMETGAFTVFVAAEYLNDSILDMLNGFYVAVGEHLVTRVCTDGTWELWRVHPNFACAVVECSHWRPVSEAMVAPCFYDRFERRRPGPPEVTVDDNAKRLRQLLPPPSGEIPVAAHDALVEALAKHGSTCIAGFHPRMFAGPELSPASLLGLIRVAPLLRVLCQCDVAPELLLQLGTFLRQRNALPHVLGDSATLRLCLIVSRSQAGAARDAVRGALRTLCRRCRPGDECPHSVAWSLTHGTPDTVLDSLLASPAMLDATISCCIEYDAAHAPSPHQLGYHLFALTHLVNLSIADGKSTVVLCIVDDGPSAPPLELCVHKAWTYHVVEYPSEMPVPPAATSYAVLGETADPPVCSEAHRLAPDTILRRFRDVVRSGDADPVASHQRIVQAEESRRWAAFVHPTNISFWESARASKEGALPLAIFATQLKCCWGHCTRQRNRAPLLLWPTVAGCPFFDWPQSARECEEVGVDKWVSLCRRRAALCCRFQLKLFWADALVLRLGKLPGARLRTTRAWDMLDAHSGGAIDDNATLDWEEAQTFAHRLFFEGSDANAERGVAAKLGTGEECSFGIPRGHVLPRGHEYCPARHRLWGWFWGCAAFLGWGGSPRPSVLEAFAQTVEDSVDDECLCNSLRTADFGDHQRSIWSSLDACSARCFSPLAPPTDPLRTLLLQSALPPEQKEALAALVRFSEGLSRTLPNGDRQEVYATDRLLLYARLLRLIKPFFVDAQDVALRPAEIAWAIPIASLPVGLRHEISQITAAADAFAAAKVLADGYNELVDIHNTGLFALCDAARITRPPGGRSVQDLHAFSPLMTGAIADEYVAASLAAPMRGLDASLHAREVLFGVTPLVPFSMSELVAPLVLDETRRPAAATGGGQGPQRFFAQPMPRALRFALDSYREAITRFRWTHAQLVAHAASATDDATAERIARTPIGEFMHTRCAVPTDCPFPPTLTFAHLHAFHEYAFQQIRAGSDADAGRLEELSAAHPTLTVTDVFAVLRECGSSDSGPSDAPWMRVPVDAMELLDLLPTVGEVFSTFGGERPSFDVSETDARTIARSVRDLLCPERRVALAKQLRAQSFAFLPALLGALADEKAKLPLAATTQCVWCSTPRFYIAPLCLCEDRPACRECATGTLVTCVARGVDHACSACGDRLTTNAMQEVLARAVDAAVVSRKVSLQYLRSSSERAANRQLGGEFRCPNTEHPRVALRLHAGAASAYCPDCGFHRCVRCGRLHHPQIRECAAVDGVAQGWEALRQSFHQLDAADAARQDAFLQHRDALIAQLRTRVAAVEALRQIFIADEAYKVDYRVCPFADCRRSFVREVGTCDFMVCGRDTHGTINFGGCLREFKYPNAPLYVHDTVGAHYRDAIAALNARAAQLGGRQPPQHPHGDNAPCAACGTPALGPRLECIHCETLLVLCQGCAGNGAMRQHVDRHAGHMFRMAFPPSPGEAAERNTLDPTVGADRWEKPCPQCRAPYQLARGDDGLRVTCKACNHQFFFCCLNPAPGGAAACRLRADCKLFEAIFWNLR